MNTQNMKRFRIALGRFMFRMGFDAFTQEYRKYMQSQLSRSVA